jgi:hypothetical protein
MTPLQLSFENQFPLDGYFLNLTKTSENTWLQRGSGDVFTLKPDSSWERKFAPKITADKVHLLNKLEDIPSETTLLWIDHAEFTEPFTFPPNLSILHLKNCKGCHFLGRLPDTIHRIVIQNCAALKDASHLFSPTQVHLESVALIGLNLEKVPDVIPPNVMTLNLDRNCITALPETCCFHKTMAHVNLEFNAMADLPQWIVRDTGPDTVISMRGNRCDVRVRKCSAVLTSFARVAGSGSIRTRTSV